MSKLGRTRRTADERIAARLDRSHSAQYDREVHERERGLFWIGRGAEPPTIFPEVGGIPSMFRKV